MLLDPRLDLHTRHNINNYMFEGFFISVSYDDYPVEMPNVFSVTPKEIFDVSALVGQFCGSAFFARWS